MKYAIISSYPKEGSKNIGDRLITNSTINIIKQVKGENSDFSVLWRAQNWPEVKDIIIASDAVVIAGLGIRKNMSKSEYPYLREILRLNKPIGILSSGTSLDMNGALNEPQNFFLTEDTEHLLKELNEKVLFFTARGTLTQRFCEKLGLNNVKMSGDVAFFDPRFEERIFQEKRVIKRIAISDPHYAEGYLTSMEYLVNEVQIIFPEAEITFVMHGVNPLIEDLANRLNIKINRIYENKDFGLDEYEAFDLHIGYRVHGHVSALKRRIPSYLLEQDGRGADYGLTINKKITVPSYYFKENELSTKNLLRKLLGKPLKVKKEVPLNSVYLLLSLVKNDFENGFKKFIGLEEQMLNFKSRCIEAVNKLP